ncbi:MAG: MBL fold metallo-hydrolase [Ruminococcaceae bacterium]|nr:MBL fold metallo-hydrolase [Oscillospiraceae bacterium]
MKIKVLAENRVANDDFIAEHGLSLYIEANGKKILFDMGKTDAFVRNAQHLDVDIPGIDFAVLSHGHYDHGGGLKKFLELNETAPVYLSKYAFGEHYADNSARFIGIDRSLEENNHLVFAGDYLKISDAFELFSFNECERMYKTEVFALTAKIDGEFIEEDFRHEQYLMINENGKRILISGCSHKGILNIMEWTKPDVLVGGFHFFKVDISDGKSEFLDAAATVLNDYDTSYYTCHCTGEEQFEYLKKQMNNLEYISCGDVVEI